MTPQPAPDTPQGQDGVSPERWHPFDRLVCAALRHRGSLAIICGPRHFDPIMRTQIARDMDPSGWKTAEQGFVNCKGIFLNREDALHVALACGQKIKRCGGDDKQLYSENLY